MFQFGDLGVLFRGLARPPWRQDWVECCTSCTTESKKLCSHCWWLCTFWLANSKKILFRLATKTLLYSWMASFTFLLWHYLL